MPLNISKITRARNRFHTDVFLKGDLKVQFGVKGLIKHAQNLSYIQNILKHLFFIRHINKAIIRNKNLISSL